MSVTPSVSSHFQAAWTSNNSHLRPHQHTRLIDKIIHVAKEVLLFIPKWIANAFARWIVYPACSPFVGTQKAHQAMQKGFDLFWYSDEWLATPRYSEFIFDNELQSSFWFQNSLTEARRIRTHYEAKEIELKTPDQKNLHGHFIQNRQDPNCQGKVVLLFGGNGEFYRSGSLSSSFLAPFAENEVPVSYLMVDPRGVNKSSGTTTRDGLLLDGDTLYQYAQSLGFAADDIILYGQSMGGAVASHVKAMHQESNAPVILSRTFGTLHGISGEFASRFPFKPIGFCQWILRKLGWTFNNTEEVMKLSSPVHILYHARDEIIPTSSALHFCVNQAFLEQQRARSQNIDIKRIVGAFASPHMQELRRTMIEIPALDSDSFYCQRTMDYLKEKAFENLTQTGIGAA